ncbi:hypothetical protein R1sor_005544 [Riccia sorocarpa]|uniref:Uncharacterized protein n=1 Tax=Riccia sorocarpa TaxID=122646 RepID=A0ABD3HJT9_9MARC
MELTLTHLCPHPKPEYKGDAVPDAALRRIEEMAGTNIRRGDVYRMLCLEGLIGPERIRRAHREVVDAEFDPWRSFIEPRPTTVVHDWTGEEFQAVDNVVHDWTGDEFQTEADIGHPEPTNDTDDYLQKFKEKWLKLVQNTEYLVEKEHDNEKFIEAVDKALYSFDRAIGQCMTALRAGRQQQTWAKTGPSMWLR